eukprot:366300-Chlamydomonas_euryale.AAC.12
MHPSKWRERCTPLPWDCALRLTGSRQRGSQLLVRQPAARLEMASTSHTIACGTSVLSRVRIHFQMSRLPT